MRLVFLIFSWEKRAYPWKLLLFQWKFCSNAHYEAFKCFIAIFVLILSVYNASAKSICEHPSNHRRSCRVTFVHRSSIVCQMSWEFVREVTTLIRQLTDNLRIISSSISLAALNVFNVYLTTPAEIFWVYLMSFAGFDLIMSNHYLIGSIHYHASHKPQT